MATEELQLQLTKFAGPLDLLLHLIKTQEIDIYDIPIAQITDQYLIYLNEMERLALDVAGEYLVMASTLMAIKSRLLLPQSKVEQLDQGEIESEDPRQVLVDQLLAYQTYQEVSHYLSKKARERSRYFTKEASVLPKQPVKPLPKGLVTTTEMAAALTHLLTKQAQDQAFVNQTIDRDVFSIEEAQDWVKQRVSTAEQQHLKFSQLLQTPVSREQVIILFLACLELMKNKVITCFQAISDDEIFVSGDVAV
ncbi:segregation and condensation protein A [Lapidilactobacillus bayanensis]|uniref:segregation and condensation protein A n=1 Tax=Lapidilactobacillus bayanensis TaxID=2485998 RepID=UPI000F77D4E8|nr:segregation/condensation protein A [Lapidilactobacillus bayanensis]